MFEPQRGEMFVVAAASRGHRELRRSGTAHKAMSPLRGFGCVLATVSTNIPPLRGYRSLHFFICSVLVLLNDEKKRRKRNVTLPPVAFYYKCSGVSVPSGVEHFVTPGTVPLSPRFRST